MSKDELERPRFQTLNAYDSTRHEATDYSFFFPMFCHSPQLLMVLAFNLNDDDSTTT